MYVIQNHNVWEVKSENNFHLPHMFGGHPALPLVQFEPHPVVPVLHVGPQLLAAHLHPLTEFFISAATGHQYLNVSMVPNAHAQRDKLRVIF